VGADATIDRADDIVATVAGAASSGTTAVTITVHADLAKVESIWRAFEPTAMRTVFQSFDWLATWQREIGALKGVVPAIAVGRDGNGAVVCIFPMGIEKRRLMRRLVFLASDLCDYNSPLLAPAFAAGLSDDTFRRLWANVARRLRADPRFRFDLVDLQKMPETVGGRRHPFRALPLRANPSRAYVATLGRDWETYYAEKRSSSTRKTERKQAKRLAEQGDIAFVQPADAAGRIATIDTLVSQKRRALARMGADDFFQRPGVIPFYRAVAANPRLRDLVQISRLDVGTEAAAASVALIDRGTLSLVLSSYHDGALSQFGPGRAHLHALMRAAIDRRLDAFDFTIGDEPYKRDWCDREVTLYDYLAAASLRAYPIVLAIRTFRAAKRRVKQSPALWHAFSRFRAKIGLGY
jgi:CelD/BcsL family acetyltransferase involved in cellulose biosynthesis